MVSAISVCLLALSLTAASSQQPSEDTVDSLDFPISERRTFKHSKPVRLLPLVKKHKKFIALAPHVFGKHSYAVPIVQESPRPIYKIHKYNTIESKPVSDVSFSTAEPYIETHSIDSPPDFGSDHSFSSPSNVFLYEKPSFQPPPVFQPVPVPFPQPIFQSIPIPQPAFPPVSIPRPAPPVFTPVPQPQPVFTPVPQPQPVFTPIPALPPPQPAVSVIPVKFQAPVLSAPSPAPVFSPVPIKIQAPALPSLPAPTPAPALPALPALQGPTPAPVIVKIPQPSVTPVPILPSFPVVSTPAPVFPSISLPPPHFSIPAPAPSVPTFPALPSLPVAAAPEVPEFHYPPSGSPIPSYIKDISLGDVEIKAPVLSDPPKFEEVSPVLDDGTIKHDPSFFDKIKEWKAHKTLSKLKPAAQAGVQFAWPVGSLPLQAAPVPASTQILHPAKYEQFPPNVETPPLFNSYGLPIPRDTYGTPSEERLSPAASEDDPAVVAAPLNKEQPPLEYQHEQHNHPVYVADHKNLKTDKPTQPEDGNVDAVVSNTHPNHKE